ncbi:MFS transporter [Arthrobacter halodurans]|uniref:MFS transporter n=1 Tax=Arthrobacter halodurans TaxID=516699 RepID=A0ABV4UKG0_9MICC
MPLGLLALAIGGFGIGLTEFVIAGLLPEVAADLRVDEAAAGWLISGYALGVAVGAIALTAAVIRRPRKRVLLGLMVLFVAGNLVSATAPDYQTMLLGRVIASLCHGAFFGIGAVVAADMVPRARRSAAIAVMFTGLTLANVLGVPFGTFIGQAYGWRATFWAITGIGILAFAGIAALVPASANGAGGTSLRGELRAFRSGQVWLSLVVTVLGFGGMFGAFTYIAYTLTEVGGFSSGAVPWLLVLFGGGLFAGNIAGGKAADRRLDASLIGLLAGLAVVLAAFALLASSQPATMVLLVLMGGFGFGTVPGLQTRIMNYAPGAATLASSANIAAFNIGNALGAWIGGAAIAAGLGYTSPLWAGSGLTVLAVAVLAAAAFAAARADRTTGAPGVPGADVAPESAAGLDAVGPRAAR